MENEKYRNLTTCFHGECILTLYFDAKINSHPSVVLYNSMMILYIAATIFIKVYDVRANVGKNNNSTLGWGYEVNGLYRGLPNQFWWRL